MTTINFNDTSEYMFRNSSTQKGGFEGNVGTKFAGTDLDVLGTEDVERSGELLNLADRDQLRAAITVLEAQSVTQFAGDKLTLVDKAGLAWDRAFGMYPVFQDLLDTEIDDMRTEMLNNLYLNTNQWARTAGSSLNCLVADMTSKAQIEIARRLAGQIAESLRRFKEHESQAVAQAFEMEMSARGRMQEIGLTNMNVLWQTLRGAETTETTDRDYTEARDENTNTFDLLGRFYHEGIDVSDNDGSYSIAGNAVSDSLGISSLIPTVA